MDDPRDNANGEMFEMHESSRVGVPVLCGFWGENGCGKTFTALHFLRGLLGEGERIAFIDTENKRSQIYADYCKPWDVLDFQPPFTPERYRKAFQQVEQKGYKGCIVDSGSHVWMGEGGVIEMADNQGRMKGLGKWLQPKTQYKKLLNALLRSKMHVIFCLRAKEKFVSRPGEKKDEIVSLGYIPDCHKDFPYEMFISVQLDQRTHKPALVKCPEQLADLFTPDKLIGIETGAKVAEWIAKGEGFEFDIVDLKRRAREQAELGDIALKAFWKGLGKAERGVVNSIGDELRDIAKTADETPESEKPMTEDEEKALIAIVGKMEKAPTMDALDKEVQDAMASTAEFGDNFHAAFSDARTDRVAQLREAEA